MIDIHDNKPLQIAIKSILRCTSADLYTKTDNDKQDNKKDCYSDLNAKEVNYYDHPSMSRSKLVDLDKMTPYKFYHKYMARTVANTSTPALRFGTAFHTAVLEPKKFNHEISIEPEHINKRTKAGKEEYSDWLIENEDKTVISSNENNCINDMLFSLSNHKSAKKMLHDCDGYEDEFYFDLMGLDFRAKLDAVDTKKNIIIDVKTCREPFVSGQKFASEMINYHNAEQVYIYSKAYEDKYGTKPTFYFICFEKTAPYEIQIWDASELYEYGKYMTESLVTKYKEITAQFGNKVWLDESIQKAELPNWAKSQCEEITLEFDDGSVTL